MKNIMIITVTAGEGHNSIAKAVRGYLEENPNNKVKTIDLFKKYSPILKQKIINEGYMAACKYAMPVYNLVYKSLQKTNPEKRNKVVAQSAILKESTKLLQDIYLFEPDVIICTHFYGAMIISNLRKLYSIPAQTIAILTDYTVHPFWEAAIGIDKLVYPSEFLKDTLIYKGFKPEQLLPLGLPVKKEFSEIMDKSQAREQLGLKQDMFTVLLMFGGGGFGKNIKIFKQVLKVKKQLQIMVVNGKDTRSKKKIDTIIKESKTKHNVFNYGFINFVSTAMSAADIMVGKAGGISVTESVNKVLPMILSVKLAQQEKANMEFLVKNKAALSFGSNSSLVRTLTSVCNNPEKLESLKKGALKVRKPNAIHQLVKLIDEADEVVYSEAELLGKQELNKLKRAIKKMLVTKEAKLEKMRIKKEKKQERQEELKKIS